MYISEYSPKYLMWKLLMLMLLMAWSRDLYRVNEHPIFEPASIIFPSLKPPLLVLLYNSTFEVGRIGTGKELVKTGTV